MISQPDRSRFDQKSATMVFRGKIHPAAVFRGLFVALAASTILISRSACYAADQTSMKVEIGWDGSFRIGCWTQVVCEINIPEQGEYQLSVTAPDPDAHRVTFDSPWVSLAAGKQKIVGSFKAGRLNPEIGVDVIAKNSGKSIGSWNSMDVTSEQTHLIVPGTRFIVVVGDAAGFDMDRTKTSQPSSSGSQDVATESEDGTLFRVLRTQASQLPAISSAYDAVTLLVLSGTMGVSAEQSAAIRDWVAAGGRLFISFPIERDRLRQLSANLSDWLPLRITENDVIVRSFGKLELFSGRNVRVPFQGRMNVPVMAIDQGEYLAGSRDEPILVRCPYGQGSVIALALDLTQAPLTKWSEVRSLGRRLTDTNLERDVGGNRSSKSVQLSSTGISDFATQLHAVQEDFAGVGRASPWVVMGLIAAWLMIVGPVDYFIVHKLIRRPRGTWITFPILVAAGAVGASSLAVQWNGPTARINELNLINVDVASGTCHQKLWTNLYNPESVRKSVQIRPAIADGGTVTTAWSGIPESSFGGMLRPIGLDVGRADYASSPDGKLQGLPFVQWSSKELVTESHGAANRLAECELQSDSAGRLTGRILHRFPSAIEDWFLVYGNRVYRQMKKREGDDVIPFVPNVSWRVEQPNVFQRELRAFLVGQTATLKKREESMGSDVIQHQQEYDIMSREPHEVLRILTFHQDAGGKSYTGLSNNPLEMEDLSQHVRMGRAVLFGRVKTAGAVVSVDGQVAKPDREYTFVRLILPVSRSSSSALPELERLGS